MRKFFKPIPAAIIATIVLVSANSASAKEGYQTVYVNPALGTSYGAGQGCAACHAGGVASASSLTTRFLNSYLSGLSGVALGSADSDGDGFNNKQEALSSPFSFIFNSAAVTPFTTAAAAESSTSTKVVVVGGGIATETVIAADPYAQTGLNLASITEVAGAVSPLVTMDPATLFFPKPIVAGSKVYIVDLVNSSSTLHPGAVFNSNGSVTVSGAGTNVNLLVDRVATVYSIGSGGGIGGGDDDDDDDDDDHDGAGSAACTGGISSTSLLIFLALLSLGFFAGRKKS